MSKIITIEDVSESASAAYGDAKKTKAFITGAIGAYGAGKIKIHVAACLAFIYAADHGDAVMLNLVHGGLEKAEQDALRAWVGTNSTYKVTDAEGSVSEKQFVAFVKDKGFVVKKGTEEHRKDKFVLKALIASGRFYAKKETVKAGMTPDQLIEWIMGLAAAAEKKADKAETAVPAELLAALSAVSKQASSYKTVH